MFVLVLNTSNILPDGSNNTLVYNFPNSVVLKEKYIAVSQIIMYYSWFNISSVYSNNIITYTWTVGGVSTTYTVNIPNGLYNITDINAFCQWTMINNGHYLINSSGDNVYYFEIIVNPNRYAIQLNTFQVPIALPVGYTQPGNFAGYPTQTFNPQVSFPQNIYQIVGYNPVNSVYFISNNNVNNAYVPPSPTSDNYFVAKDTLGTLSYLSNTSPNVQPNSSVYLSISNINNPYSQPSSILYAITPSVAIGEQIIETPPNFMWNRLIDGTYNQIRLQFLGIDKRPLTIADPNMTIMLTIRDKDESLIGLK
jgi:hypothetical protein